MQSLPPSQLTLQKADGTSIVPSHAPKCPNCKVRGTVVVLTSDPIPDGRLRMRACITNKGGCGHSFETISKLPDECPHCGSIEGFGVKRTIAISNGYYRTHRCRNCKKMVKSLELFPVPADKVKRPHALIHNS